MENVVVGVGYTGRRVLSLLPPPSTGLNRPQFDLDQSPQRPAALSAQCSLLYTVPPNPDCGGDARLQTFLQLLDVTPARFVYLSTSGVYGDRQGSRVTEDDAVAPLTARAKRRLAAETLLQRWSEKNGAELIILRLPGIYGPGRLGIDRISAGTRLVKEAEAGPANRIHVDDLAACCVLALRAPAPPGIYNIADGDHRSSTWFTKTVARLAGLPAPVEISRAQADKTFTAMRRSFLNESRTLDTTRMRKVLGFTPRYANAEDGIRASLAEQKKGSEPFIGL